MIYCVEDDDNIRELVVYTLRGTGFEAVGCRDGQEFFRKLDMEKAELALLDIMLPGMDGMEILKNLRAARDTARLPVIMVTAKGAEYDKVIGLDKGADDYIAKPFGMMELIARVRAVLRRRPPSGAEKTELTVGSLSISAARRLAEVNGAEVALTYKEFELLLYLMDNRGLAVSRDSLLEKVWGYDFEGGTRTVDAHVRSLRQKLGSCGRYIETVRGVGYRMGDGGEK